MTAQYVRMLTMANATAGMAAELVRLHRIEENMHRLADDLDRETPNLAAVVASDIRDILDGHPERVAWNVRPGEDDRG